MYNADLLRYITYISINNLNNKCFYRINMNTINKIINLTESVSGCFNPGACGLGCH